ncbi:AbrB/MazE/SpoVT family DNA-binding domain-containing protein [Paenibacillus xerothermodurans]|uniref:AbrB/MazE/SpoVT family DNA-binding domain-containing protein n=1 Tax=Paenibacillus xerothermodurans TaxID=1977292 RepID=A0A2W1NMQ8_PAEXE|nr:AbrB/MazE/SpoVT family DNA-binding domain-containing protein [Paenibacillus xerothermodurans]PZE20253.1 AbrB/MazE/SpoVT family DNA-binding domain-containing protein [Paenibacillus xerothermodurans]
MKHEHDSSSRQHNLTQKGKEQKPMNATIERVEATTKITSKGQITFPARLMKELGLKEGDQLRFILTEDGLSVVPIRLMTADELFGIFDRPEDEGNFVLDLDAARKGRTEEILSKYGATTTEEIEFGEEDRDLD